MPSVSRAKELAETTLTSWNKLHLLAWSKITQKFKDIGL